VLRVLSCGVHKNISFSKSKIKISQVLIITGVINIVSMIMILSESKQLEFISHFGDDPKILITLKFLLQLSDNKREKAFS
jgi:hypothetical protein